MLKYLIKNSIRNIINQFRFSIINATGLIIGISTFVIIFSWVKYELSFDSFNEDKNSIYRVVTTTGAETPNPMALTLLDEVPEVVASVRYQVSPTLTFKVDDKLFYENKVALADPELFQLFNFPFLNSTAEEALSHPFNIVLTEKMARKYFAEEDAMGKTILIENKIPARVTGIIKDLPNNSHLQFDCVVPYIVMKELGFDLNDWYNWNPITYIKLNNASNPDDVCTKVQTIAENNRKNSSTETFVLQPLKDIHFNTKLDFDTAITTNPVYIYILSIGAFLILIIATINYINLSVALQKKRIKEVGIKRTLGATKTNVIKQIFVETGIMVLFSFVISFFVVYVTKSYYNDFLGDNISFNFISFESLVVFSILVVLIAGISSLYPAWLMSSLKLSNILGNKIQSVSKGFSLRQVPLTLQFTLSILLIIVAFSISNQLNFIKNTDLGFNSKNIVYLPLKNNSEAKFNSFKNELLKDSNIESVAVKDNSILGLHGTNGSLEWEGKLPGEKLWVDNIYIDCQYFKILDVKFTEGRNFIEHSATDSKNAVIVNEELIKRIKLENPVGKQIKYQGKNKQIIGVIEDAHFQSLHKSIEPQIYQVANFTTNINEEALVIVKYNKSEKAGTIASVMANIKNTWNQIYPELPYSYTFLHQQVENQYKSEQKLTVLMYIFSGMSILLSCLGLLAITVFIAEKRTKEIGIRKVNGAKVSEILSMLNKDFIKWVAIAFVVACPIAYYAMNKWLESFAYKTTLSWWIFALAGLLALGIALLTVSWQSWRAATRNPVEALRYE